MRKLIRAHLQEHDELFWRTLEIAPQNPCVLINFDAHSDMSMFDGKLKIGNFISKMAHQDLIDEVIWVKDQRSIDFEIGEYIFNYGKESQDSNRLVCDLEVPFYFLQNSFLPLEKIINPKKLKITVVEDPSKILPQKNKKWILSVDYDYFACEKPIKPDIEKIKNYKKNNGIDFFDELYTNAKKIKSFKDWADFYKKAEEKNPGIARIALQCFYPDYDAEKFEIEKKTKEGLRNILEKFNLQLCLGLYSISSLSSGFVRSNKYDIIKIYAELWLDFIEKKWNMIN